MKATTLIIIAGLFGLACKKTEPVTSDKKAESIISVPLAVDFNPLFDTTHLEKVNIGELYLPTGEIVASDPFYMKDVEPFSTKVTSGTYPVEVLIFMVEENHYRVAFAKIKFSESPAIRWELAVTGNVTQAQLDSLETDEFFGYGVDAGLGCFADAETARIFNDVMSRYDKEHPDGNYYEDILAAEFTRSSQHPFSSDGGDWNNHFPKKGDKHNVIIFSSGWGDGAYATYWGFDPAGKVFELITDFGVVGGE